MLERSHKSSNCCCFRMRNFPVSYTHLLACSPHIPQCRAWVLEALSSWVDFSSPGNWPSSSEPPLPPQTLHEPWDLLSMLAPGILRLPPCYSRVWAGDVIWGPLPCAWVLVAVCSVSGHSFGWLSDGSAVSALRTLCIDWVLDMPLSEGFRLGWAVVSGHNWFLRRHS